MGSKRVWLILGIVLASVAALVFIRYQSKTGQQARLQKDQKARRSAPASVEVAVAQPRPLIDSVEAVGTVSSPFSVGISPRVQGRITFLGVREGDPVKQGQVVARIDPSDANAKVMENQASVSEARSRLAQAQATVQANDVQIQQNIRQARAELASAQAAWRQAKTTLDGKMSDAQAAVDTAKAAVESAQVKVRNQESQLKASKVVLANSQTKLRRVQNLLEKGFVAVKDVDDATSAVATAQAEVEVAQGGVDTAASDLASARVDLQAAMTRVRTTASSGKAELDSDQAKIEQARAALAQAVANQAQSPAYQANVSALKAGVAAAEAQLKSAGVTQSDTEMRSSITGWVTARSGDPGSIASPGQPVVKVEFLDWLYIDASVPVSQSGQVHKGLPVQISLEGISQTFSGRVDQAVPSADPQDRQFVVKVRVENPEHRIRPGMFARVSIEVERHEAKVVVPMDAVSNDDTVTRIDAEDKAHIVKVSLGRQSGGSVEVVQGLDPGDRVVVLSYMPVKEGRKVAVSAVRLPDGTRRLMKQEKRGRPSEGGRKP